MLAVLGTRGHAGRFHGGAGEGSRDSGPQAHGGSPCCAGIGLLPRIMFMIIVFFSENNVDEKTDTGLAFNEF